MTPGASIVGPALTLQFMPKREDLYPEDEYVDPERQLHRHVLYHAQPGDVVVVDARGDLTSGVFGAMMMTYFRGRGGLGVVIDGAVRDSTEIKAWGWDSGCAASRRTSIPRPISFRSPSTCPSRVAASPSCPAISSSPTTTARWWCRSSSRHDWRRRPPSTSSGKSSARLKLSEGGDLRRYYPLTEAARSEYEAWRSATPSQNV